MKATVWLWFIALAGGCSREPAAHAADNTGVNARDKDGDTLTPTDQSESEADRTLTQQARRNLMDDATLSMNAKNIKIMTVAGRVTLRGVVASATERSRVEGLVQAIPGVLELDNQLEVETD